MDNQVEPPSIDPNKVIDLIPEPTSIIDADALLQEVAPESDSIVASLAELDILPPGVMLILGIAVFGGLIGAWVFQKLRFPQVTGYIIIGLLLGPTGFGVVGQDTANQLEALVRLALGVIGFLVGCELRGELFKKYWRQFVLMVLGEGVLAFLLVGIVSTLFAYIFLENFAHSLAVGVVLGAVASATDPASTIDVLWEYRGKGVMTTAIIALVALDDALAMTLYGIGSGLAQVLTGGQSSIMQELSTVGLHLFCELGLGALAGLLLSMLLRFFPQPERATSMALAVILLVIGMARMVKMDVIMMSMACGIVLVNLEDKRGRELCTLVRGFATPLYVIFFVLVGARLTLGAMPWWLWGLVVIYVVFRTLGKYFGTWLGAKFSKAEVSVQKYAGLGLFTQGGVAVGLSILAAERLQGIKPGGGDLSLGDMVVMIVAATTLLVQVIGPSFVKLALRLSGEIGRNVTEGDIIDSWRVADAMDARPVTLHRNTPVREIVARMASGEARIYPVVNDSGKVEGVVFLDTFRSLIGSPNTWSWVLADDVMQTITLDKSLTPASTLSDALYLMQRQGIDQALVLNNDNQAVGILDRRHVRERVQRELLRREGLSEHSTDLSSRISARRRSPLL